MQASELRERLNHTEPSAEGGARQFVKFDKATLAQSGLKPWAREFLITVGLPCLGGANLRFSSYEGEELTRWKSKLPHGFYPIGTTNSEDLITIEAKSDVVWLFESSLYDTSTQINQSISSLAESLCIYEECQAEESCRCLERIAVNDPESAKEGCYWFPYALGHMLKNPQSPREKRNFRAAAIIIYGIAFTIIFSLAWSNGCLSRNHEFNPERWQAEPGFFDSASIRKTMVADLIESKLLIGLSLEDLRGLLGKEDKLIRKEGQVQLQYKLGPLSFSMDVDPDTLYLCVEFEGSVVKHAHSFEGYANPIGRER